jgi:hypothetical protein
MALGVAVVAAVALAASPALAAKGGGGHTSSAVVSGTISLDQSSPHYGDTVTFTTSATGVSSSTVLRIGLICSQNGTDVYMLSGVVGTSFPLGGPNTSSAWNGGAASCTATLFYYTYQGQVQSGVVTLASTTFGVAA